MVACDTYDYWGNESRIVWYTECITVLGAMGCEHYLPSTQTTVCMMALSLARVVSSVDSVKIFASDFGQDWRRPNLPQNKGKLFIRTRLPWQGSRPSSRPACSCGAREEYGQVFKEEVSVYGPVHGNGQGVGGVPMS